MLHSLFTPKKIITALVLILLIVVGYELFGSSLKSFFTNDTKELRSKFYLDSVGQRLPLAVTTEQDPNAGLSVTIIGVINKVYSKENRYYMDLVTLAGDKSVLLTVDLGTNDFKIQEHTVVEEGTRPEVISPNTEYSFSNLYRVYPASNIYDRYRSKQNKVVKIEIMVIPNEAQYKTNCNETCQQRLQEFSLHKENNQKLLRVDKTPDNKLTIGFPTLISLSQ